MDWLSSILSNTDILDIVVSIVALAIGELLRRYVGITVNQKTLRSAIRSGLLSTFDALADGRITKDEAIDLALSYVRAGGADTAARKLKASEDALRTKAKAELADMIRERLLPAPKANPST